MSIFTSLIGGVLEEVYGQVGSINLSNATTAIYTIGAKLILIKSISQDLGEAPTVTFLAAHDAQLGPYAQQVVDAVNGNEDGAASVVLALLLGSTSATLQSVGAVAATVDPSLLTPEPSIVGAVGNPQAAG